MRILDLFCGAGGAGMGYHMAGFTVVGVDLVPQPDYPFEFHLGDAMEWPLDGYDVIHASPPCQAYTRMGGLLRSMGTAGDYPDLIAATRARLVAGGTPYVIENVEGSPLVRAVRLCGSMFGLQVQRHRLFESNVMLMAPCCNHGVWRKDKPGMHRHQSGRSRIVGCYGNSRGVGDNLDVRRAAMGIDWMGWRGLTQAIPPAYTEYIGRQLIAALYSERRKGQINAAYRVFRPDRPQGPGARSQSGDAHQVGGNGRHALHR